MTGSTPRARANLVGAAALALALPGAGLAGQQHDRDGPPETAASATLTAGGAPTGAPAVTRTLEREGLAVEMTLTPVAGSDAEPGVVRRGEDVELRLAFTDVETGGPVADLFLAAWVDHRGGPGRTSEEACRTKIQSYLRGTLQFRPTLDLNSHFIVALNEGSSVAALDPVLGFSVSNVYAGTPLKGEGADWVTDAFGKWIFVTMPEVDAVAVVNADTWKVETNLDVGSRPGRIDRAPEDGGVWVSDGGPGGREPGVTVIDPRELAVRGRVPTGAGPHAMAFDGDGRHLFVANRGSGTLSVVDAGAREVVREIPTGPRPVSVAYSRISRAAYVADAEDGTITVVDGSTLEVSSVLETAPSLASLSFDPSGRWGFAVSPEEKKVYVVDATEGKVRRSFTFEEAPGEVGFTDNFAYVRLPDVTDVAMIALEAISRSGEIEVMSFPAGWMPREGDDGRPAATMVPASHHGMTDAVYLASPGDQSVYRFNYMMGMPMPGGRLNTFPFRPKALMIVSRSLRETAPGQHTATIRVPAEGDFDVVLLLDDPRVVHCFDFSVVEQEDAPRRQASSVRIEPLLDGEGLPAGEAATFRFRIVDVATGEPEAGAEDVQVLLATPMGWSDRLPATPVGEDAYQVTATLPDPGYYRMVVASPTIGVPFGRQVAATIRAVRPDGEGAR